MPEAIIAMVAGWPVALQVLFSGGVLLVAYAHGPKLYHAAKSKITGNGNGHAASTRQAVEALEGRMLPEMQAIRELLHEIHTSLLQAREDQRVEFSETRKVTHERHEHMMNRFQAHADSFNAAIRHVEDVVRQETRK